jgi:glutamyl-tRNA reductase
MSVSIAAACVVHDSVPLALLERLELTAARARELVSGATASEAVALSTCNRAELYLVGEGVGDVAVQAFARATGVPAAELQGAVRQYRGIDAARHLIRVTSGLESMVLGEAEIQGQVSRAYGLALGEGSSGPITNRMFQGALRAAKRVRSETGVTRSPVSVASVAVDLARRTLGGLAGRHVLVIGAGKHAELTARTLTEQGADTVFVASRTHDGAAELASRFGGAAVRFDQLREQLARAELVLTCTACPHRVLTRDDLGVAAERRLVVIDTAMPRDVDPLARNLPGVELYDLDDIRRELAINLSARGREALLAVPIVEQELASFERWLASLDVVPTIAALHRRGHAAVERALRANEHRWQGLSDGDRERVELLARSVVSDLLHEPTRRLRSAGERGSSCAYVQTLSDLFGLGGEAEPEAFSRASGVRVDRAGRAAPIRRS